MSSIRAIAIRDRPGAAMQTIDNAKISVANGIQGDFRGSQAGRQITVLGEISWRQACAEVDADLPWTTRRANLLVDDIEFDASWVGKILRIGEAELVITRETDPCSLMDAEHPGLKAALLPAWRGGVCCKVVKPGEIKIGDQIEFD
jgi:MOSC domain-containing protein YiiM